MQVQVSTNRGRDDAMAGRWCGFARRRNMRGAWRETVTEYTPQPWLIALKRDRTGLPVRPGHRPGANR
jgi:hypothetical protein